MNLNWLTILLFLIAVALRSELFFAMLYIVVGLQLVTRLWLHYSVRRLNWRRNAPAAAFPGERLTVQIELNNNGLLPLPWLSLHESLPPALRHPPMIREVLSLGAGEQRVIRYELASQRRGYYRLGPLALRTGDVLGLGEQPLTGQEPDSLTIYPPILPLATLGLPASLPYGTLATSQRLFDDPARPAGVRPYQASDGVRRIDWKTTAHAATPQVRRYQPAIALETLIALAFSREEYGGRFAYDIMERALVAAASIAAQLSAQRQPVGLCVTGNDPAFPNPAQNGAILPVANGRAHLMSLLGLLGRLESTLKGELLPLVRQASTQLGWGSTVIVITGQRGDELLADLLALRRRGLNVALIITEPSPDELALPRQHGIATYGLWRDGLPAAAQPQ